MGALELAVLGAVIGANNLAVALTLGALGQARHRWRIVAIFGAFEFVVPLVGLMLGRELADDLGAVGNWLAPLLLAALGLVAIVGAGTDADEDRMARRATTPAGLVVLAAGLSADNLIIGFGLGARDVAPLALAGVIASCSIAFTLIGLQVGAAGRRRWEQTAEVGAGALLVLLAVAIAFGWVG